MSKMLDLLNEMTHPETMSQEQQAAVKAAGPYWDKVQEAFSWKFADEMYEAVDKAWVLECEEHFARGFHLGAKICWRFFCHNYGRETCPPRQGPTHFFSSKEKKRFGAKEKKVSPVCCVLLLPPPRLSRVEAPCNGLQPVQPVKGTLLYPQGRLGRAGVGEKQRRK